MHACRHSYPSSGGHDAVVDHVEGGQVAELLVEEEEDGVQHVQELGEVVPPGCIQRCHGHLAACSMFVVRWQLNKIHLCCSYSGNT